MQDNQRKDARGTSPEFDCWLDSFFDSYYRHRPVNATFIGIHEYDSQLPDYSESGIGDNLADMQSLLHRAKHLAREPLARSQTTDKRLCEGFLQIQTWEYKSDHGVLGNPGLYVGEAIFGVLASFLSDYAPITDRIAAATERLHAIPALLQQCEDNINTAPAKWVEHAIIECRGALAFLENGALLAAQPLVNSSYEKGVDEATKAFTKFGSFLEHLHESSAIEILACGEEVLSLHLRAAHCLADDADDIVGYAESQLLSASAYLDDHCADFDATSPAEVLAELHEIHPACDNYYDRYQDIWNDIRSIAEENELVTWPDFPIRYVPQPDWARAAAQDLYFLFYRSPAAFGRPPVHDYLVTPIDKTMPIELQNQLLQANNDSAIKLNHVVHHGGIGHHIQNWHAFRSSCRVGQVAAVDCASRIAMNCGGTMAEGWACYATDLMAETGALSAREVYAEQQTRTRMCSRAIVDIRLHQGRFSFEQAVDFYVQNAGMTESNAIYEATRNSMYPGSAVMYLTGCDAIHELRSRMSSLHGDQFKLRDFHDRLLSYGSIPVALIAEAMLEEAE